MKKLISIIAICLMAVCLCSCNTPKVTEITITPAPTAVQEQTPAEAQTETYSEPDEGFVPLLEELCATVRPGSSGSSLRAVSMAAKLLDLMSVTDMDAQTAMSALSAYAEGLDEADRWILEESLASVLSSVKELKSDTAAELLETAGCESSLCPWNDKAFELVESLSLG